MNPSDNPSVRQRIGACVLFSGVAICALILLDLAVELSFMPSSWYRHRHLWGLIGLGLFAWGWKLQRSETAALPAWSPGPPGRRFRRLIVYSRADCHLCDDAKAVLAKYLDYLPDIEEIDIDTRPELQERFGTSIPVVQFDDQVRFRGKVDEILLRRLLEGTGPVGSGESEEGG